MVTEGQRFWKRVQFPPPPPVSLFRERAGMPALSFFAGWFGFVRVGSGVAGLVLFLSAEPSAARNLRLVPLRAA